MVRRKFSAALTSGAHRAGWKSSAARRYRTEMGGGKLHSSTASQRSSTPGDHPGLELLLRTYRFCGYRVRPQFACWARPSTDRSAEPPCADPERAPEKLLVCAGGLSACCPRNAARPAVRQCAYEYIGAVTVPSVRTQRQSPGGDLSANEQAPYIIAHNVRPTRLVQPVAPQIGKLVGPAIIGNVPV